MKRLLAVAVVTLSGCAGLAPPGTCPELSGAYLADGRGFDSGRRTSAYLGDFPPLAGREGEPGVVTVVRIEGPADGRVVFAAGNVSRELFRVELSERGYRCEAGVLVVSTGYDVGIEPLLLAVTMHASSAAFRRGVDGSLYVHAFERDTGIVLGLPLSFGLDNGWSRFREYKGPPLAGVPEGTR